MTINGVEILHQCDFYSINWQTSIIFSFLLIIAFIGVFHGIKVKENEKLAMLSMISLAIMLCSMPLIFNTSNSTIFNHPIKTQYVIEIKDDNAWKEIGPKYVVIKKIYDTKEIYLIEGDYVND